MDFYSVLCNFFILFIVLMPDVPLPVLGNARPEDGILLLLFALALSQSDLRSKLLNPTRYVRECTLFLGIFLALLIFTAIVNHLEGYLTQWGPILKEFVRFLKYICVLNLFALMPIANINRVFQLLLGVSLVTLVVQLLQRAGMHQVNDFLNAYYGFPMFRHLANFSQVETGIWRSGATFMNPNVLSNFLLLPFAVAFSFLWVRQGTSRMTPIVPRFVALVIALLTCIGVLLTGSRSALILVFGIMVIVLLLDAHYSAKLKLGVVAVLSAFVAFIGLATNQTRGFRGFQEISGQNSFLVKTQKFLEVVDSFQTAPSWVWLTGKSPGASYIHADTEYGYLMYWYGLLGVAIYGGFLCYLLKHFWARRYMPFSVAMIAIVFAFAVYGVSATSFLNNRIFPLFLAILGASLVAEKESGSAG